MTISKHHISDDIRLYITRDLFGTSSVVLVHGDYVIPMSQSQGVKVAELISNAYTTGQSLRCTT